MTEESPAVDSHQVGTYSIRAVDRVCDIIDTLRRAPEGTLLTTLSAQVDMPKSSVLRYLSALEARRFVARDERGLYRLGIALRSDLRGYLDELRHVAMPHLEAIRDEFGETTNLGILDGFEVLHVAVCESAQAVRLAARAGDRAPLHATAMGKAASTLLPEEAVVTILRAAPMEPVTVHTLTTEDMFLAAVQQARSVGYALDDLENQPDGRCVAVPLPGLAAPAALSVSAPASRFTAARAREVGVTLGSLATGLLAEASQITA